LVSVADCETRSKNGANALNESMELVYETGPRHSLLLTTSSKGLRMKLKASAPSFFAAILLASLTLIQATPAEPPPHQVQVTAKRFEFAPAEIVLKKGEPVVLTLKSLDVAHGIRFKELGVEVKVAKGQTAQLSFTPNKTGTFAGHCSVFCGSGHGSMTLTLHVVD
jgi:cytochrome c oxidase subunit 2